MTMRVFVLYPDRLHLYADRGNITVLVERCRRRDIPIEVVEVRLGETWPAGRPHLVYLGGGQDRDQRVCAHDLRRHRRAIADTAAEGGVVLGVCGGYQLLAHEYRTPDGTIDGIGLLDATTERPDGPRLVGNAVVSVASGRLPWAIDGSRRLVGFENHQGRTRLGVAAAPLGTVTVGSGNNGEDRTEGAVSGSVIGTYLHGPLFAKNVWFADDLIAHSVGGPLSDLDDRFAGMVHQRAVEMASRAS